MAEYKVDGSKKFSIANFDCADTGEFTDRSEAIPEFIKNLEKINEYQQRLFAEQKEGIIFVFQAMDAAGKDGAVRAVLSCLSPQGVSEHSFKVPSAEEASHDFLWRFWDAIPAKGSISIFNRSYYEDVLVQRVHSLYKNNKWADRIDQDQIIENRYGQIRNFEKYLWENSIRVVKVFLNVSKEEQAQRFMSRIETQKKNWKFSKSDIDEREYWDEYMKAYEICINKTARENTPWYVVPADHKWYARLIISRIVLNELMNMDPQWPVLPDENLQLLASYKAKLALEIKMTEDEKAKKDKTDSKGASVTPADTAIAIAYREGKKANSEKKLRKQVEKYYKTKLEENPDMVVSDETFDAIKDIVMDREEMAAAAELESAKILNDLYDDHKETMGKYVDGFGKEANKLFGRFKSDCKDCIKQYEEAVNTFYNDYENAIGTFVNNYEIDINEKNVEPKLALQIFSEKVGAEYANSRNNANQFAEKTSAELEIIFNKYMSMAELFHKAVE